MKSILSLVFMLFVSARAFSAEASIEFRGVAVGGGPTKLSLVDKANDTARWVEVGKTFAGFTITAYDPAIETATLTKDGKEFRIRLNTSKIMDAPAGEATAASTGSTGKIPLATARMIYNNLRQVAAAADQYYLETGKNTATLNDLVGLTGYIKQLKPEAGEDYSVLKLDVGNSLFSVTTASGETITWNEKGKGSTFYTVRPGETLEQIVEKTGSSAAQLMELNGITNPADMKPGLSLRTK